MNVNIIVAIDQNKAIGKDNKLLWHLPNDLKFFKKTTSGHTVIMGRKTFDSIGKPLPNRRNLVISSNKDLKIEGAEVFHSIEEALEHCKQENEVFILGGAKIYQQVYPLTQRFFVTQVHHTFDADTFFSDLNTEELRETWREDHYRDEKHDYDYSFLILERQ